ncbi:MAG: hypothetical protein LC775_00610, partial [Acidobacteria bacterium]|nr:hypothetical protein [Acidobacteriota bacterium]
VCARVNDPETARMILAALDDDAHRRALTIPRAGQAMVQTGADWHYARGTYLTTPERRALAARHAEQTLTLRWPPSWPATSPASPGRPSKFDPGVSARSDL